MKRCVLAMLALAAIALTSGTVRAGDGHKGGARGRADVRLAGHVDIDIHGHHGGPYGFHGYHGYYAPGCWDYHYRRPPVIIHHYAPPPPVYHHYYAYPQGMYYHGRDFGFSIGF